MKIAGCVQPDVFYSGITVNIFVVVSYPMSEMKRLYAQARRHGVEAAVSHAREKLYHITSRPYSVDADSLRYVLYFL